MPIPPAVLEAYAQYRPTPLVYASGLKKRLDTPAHIFYKYEGVSPMGSHKGNTALMQAYLAAQEGVRELVTETGAGQWGSALAYAGERFGVAIRVFMVRASFRQKPGRRTLMSPVGGAGARRARGTGTDAGRAYFQAGRPTIRAAWASPSPRPWRRSCDNPGSKYALGSVLDSVLLHQTVIGQEAETQLAALGLEPDMVIGCVGGGSNFAGISFPFVRKKMTAGKKTDFVAVEPESCPSLTGGELRYDHGDSAGLTPLLYMHTLGRDFIPPAIHAGGLRYHGMAPLVSHLVGLGLVRARACAQDEVFAAAKTFFASEGILPAPESAHAVAAVIAEAKQGQGRQRGKSDPLQPLRATAISTCTPMSGTAGRPPAPEARRGSRAGKNAPVCYNARARCPSMFDVILVQPYPFADHPSFPEGILKRALEAAGFSVGVIEAPFWQERAVLHRPGAARPVFRGGARAASTRWC